MVAQDGSGEEEGKGGKWLILRGIDGSAGLARIRRPVVSRRIRMGGYVDQRDFEDWLFEAFEAATLGQSGCCMRILAAC